MSFRDMVSKLLGVAIPVFGEVVTYGYVDGGQTQIKGVFDLNFDVVDPESQAIVSSNQPRLGVRLSDLEQAPKVGDRVTRADLTVWRVTDSQEDGQGGASLIMRKATA